MTEGHDYWWPDPEEEEEFERKLREILPADRRLC
jgi:hypothetical protein